MMERSKEQLLYYVLIKNNFSSQWAGKMFAFLRRNFFRPSNEMVASWQAWETNMYKSRSFSCCVTHIVAAENIFWWTTCQIRISL